MHVQYVRYVCIHFICNCASFLCTQKQSYKTEVEKVMIQLEDQEKVCREHEKIHQKYEICKKKLVELNSNLNDANAVNQQYQKQVEYLLFPCIFLCQLTDHFKQYSSFNIIMTCSKKKQCWKALSSSCDKIFLKLMGVCLCSQMISNIFFPFGRFLSVKYNTLMH